MFDRVGIGVAAFAAVIGAVLPWLRLTGIHEGVLNADTGARSGNGGTAAIVYAVLLAVAAAVHGASGHRISAVFATAAALLVGWHAYDLLSKLSDLQHLLAILGPDGPSLHAGIGLIITLVAAVVVVVCGVLRLVRRD